MAPRARSTRTRGAGWRASGGSATSVDSSGASATQMQHATLGVPRVRTRRHASRREANRLNRQRLSLQCGVDGVHSLPSTPVTVHWPNDMREVYPVSDAQMNRRPRAQTRAPSGRGNRGGIASRRGLRRARSTTESRLRRMRATADAGCRRIIASVKAAAADRYRQASRHRLGPTA